MKHCIRQPHTQRRGSANKKLNPDIVGMILILDLAQLYGDCFALTEVCALQVQQLSTVSLQLMFINL